MRQAYAQTRSLLINALASNPGKGESISSQIAEPDLVVPLRDHFDVQRLTDSASAKKLRAARALLHGTVALRRSSG